MKLPSGLAVAAMVVGIVSIPIMCIPYLNVLTLPCSITAIVMGCIANGKAKRGEGGGKEWRSRESCADRSAWVSPSCC